MTFTPSSPATANSRYGGDQGGGKLLSQIFVRSPLFLQSLLEIGKNDADVITDANVSHRDPRTKRSWSPQFGLGSYILVFKSFTSVCRSSMVFIFGYEEDGWRSSSRSRNAT